MGAGLHGNRRAAQQISMMLAGGCECKRGWKGEEDQQPGFHSSQRRKLEVFSFPQALAHFYLFRVLFGNLVKEGIWWPEELHFILSLLTSRLVDIGPVTSTSRQRNAFHDL